MSAYAEDFVAVAMTQSGKPYRLGAEAGLHDPNPSAFDCSELVQWALARVGIAAPDGTVNQFPWRIPCSVQQAVNTRGALLFIWKGPHAGGGGGNHVAISLGNGKTIEARSTRHGVGVFDAHGRGWTHGGLVPGLRYVPKPAPSPALSTEEQTAVDLCPTPSGRGYWIVASDGGVFSFGDAPFYGSMGGRPLAAPVVGMAPIVRGGAVVGYWLAGADGGVFTFPENAGMPEYGSLPGLGVKPVAPVVDIVATPTGNGYWMLGADGGVFAFGDAVMHGSAVEHIRR